MSEQSGPHSDDQPDQSHGRRGKKKTKPAPQLQDYPVGMRVIAEFRDMKGKQSFFKVEIVDSYQGMGFSHWGSRSKELKVFGRIYNVSNKDDLDLITHIVPLSLNETWMFGHRGPLIRTVSEVELGGAGYFFLLADGSGNRP